ncbi:MAG: hypothetical protein O8C61_00940 [Candidatus Methanoperedens sp.]|nr:hypothetical protein [Candidatus Methanoperedens sp.]
MSIKELEEEIAEIEKVRERFKPGTLQWNNINNIITDKKRELSRLKNPDSCEEDHLPDQCGGDCSSCGM